MVVVHSHSLIPNGILHNRTERKKQDSLFVFITPHFSKKEKKLHNIVVRRSRSSSCEKKKIKESRYFRKTLRDLCKAGKKIGSGNKTNLVADKNLIRYMGFRTSTLIWICQLQSTGIQKTTNLGQTL